MSYFYATPITSLDIQNGKSEKKKLRRKGSTNGFDLKPVHGYRHRRKHSSKNCSSKSRSILINEDNDDESISSPKSKYKRPKEVSKLLNDNEKLQKKFETHPESGFIDGSSEKESQLLKYKNRCSKLEKSSQERRKEMLKLQNRIQKQENDYRQLDLRYQELIKIIQSSDQEKSILLIEHTKSKSENAQLNEDVSLLKVLIYRLNVEIERYQDKLRISNLQQINSDGPDIDPTTESKKILESWGRVKIHVLGPLLDAYNENLGEKEQLIKEYRQEIDNFGGQCKQIVAENNELRKEIDKYKLRIDNYTSEIETLFGDASIIKEENNILLKQQLMQKQKLHEIHSVYEAKVESMCQDNNKLHTDYLACKTELSNFQGKYEILSESFEKIKKNSQKIMPISVHSEAIEECKRLFEELKYQYESEKKKLLCKLQKFEENNPENDRLLTAATTERDYLKQLTKNLEKNLKHTQHKLECLQGTLCSIQVSRDSFKRQLAKTTSYCEELVNEQDKLFAEKKELTLLLLKRQKENENIQNLGDNIVYRMRTLKNQLKSVQKGAREQLQTVEKHMKVQEVGASQIKSDYYRELQRLKQLIKQKEDVIGKLQREKFTTQDNLELIWKTATNKEKKVKDVLKN